MPLVISLSCSFRRGKYSHVSMPRMALILGARLFDALRFPQGLPALRRETSDGSSLIPLKS
jgi:hypothetical protein